MILGASGRAAAQSACRAGLEPWVVDLFADRDLAAVATVHALAMSDYPEALERFAAAAPPGPWIYTGALENSPDLVDRIAAQRPLWGISGSSLRDIRDPFAVADLLRRHDLPAAEVRRAPRDLPRDGSWLVKPRASAGGRRIAPLSSDFRAPAWPVYFQKRIAGVSGSALFLGLPGDAQLRGATRQWIGRAGSDFAYMGSIGPWAVPDRKILDRVGRVLARGFGLVGLFGVDFVLDPQGRPFVVEVNPRYTASVELLEWSLGRSLLAEHARVFEPSISLNPLRRRRPPKFVAKWILFADHESSLADLDRRQPRAGRSFAMPPLADLPACGSRFAPAQPIMTILARGRTWESCRARLMRRVARWQSRLVVAPHPTARR